MKTGIIPQAISAPRRAEGKKAAAASKGTLVQCPITVAIGKSDSKSPPRLLHLPLLLLAVKSLKFIRRVVLDANAQEWIGLERTPTDVHQRKVSVQHWEYVALRGQKHAPVSQFSSKLILVSNVSEKARG